MVLVGEKPTENYRSNFENTSTGNPSTLAVIHGLVLENLGLQQ
jgi:hypothetical protein